MNSLLEENNLVLFLFKSQSIGVHTYAVPKEVAEHYQLADYDEADLDDSADILQRLSPYKVPHILTYHDEC